MQKALLALAILGATATASVAAPVNPLALYTFENGLLTDDSGNGNTGTDKGSVSLSFGTGQDGGAAASFSGVGGAVGIDTGIDINRGVLPVLTMGAWVFLDSYGTGNPKFLSHDNGGYDRTLGVDDRGNDPGKGFMAFTGAFTADAPGTAPIGSWQHVAVVYNGTSSAIYLNGLLADTFTDFTGTVDSSFNLHIGGNPGFNEGWDGLVDDVFVYGRALNTTEIQDIVANGFDAAPVPLPASGLLLLGAVGGAAAWRKRRAA